MPSFIIVDWGTTNFRAFLIDENNQTIDSLSSNDGMIRFEKNEFHPLLVKQLEPWLSKNKTLKILMSGMVGSLNGWLETKYLACNVNLDELSQNLVQIPNIKEEIYIVPGVKTLKNGLVDLMRGEEIQIFGTLQHLKVKDAVLILPGTHCKWAQVENENIVDFKTNMTGEVFSALSTNTILAKSIKSKEINNHSFQKGLELSSKKGGIFNQIFQARAQAKNIGEDKVYSFLSGILIGHEVKEMSELFATKKVIIVGNSTLNSLYEKALSLYKIDSAIVDSSVATNNAMIYIYKNQKVRND